MHDLIKIDAQPARLAVNFDELKEQLQQQLKEYDIVVTADTVGDAKKLATELNKQASSLDAKRKEAVAEVSAPIKEADGQMKELVGLYKEGRQKILSQVERFEDETRELCREKLEQRLHSLWHEYEVTKEHARTSIEDLVKISNVTAKGNLTQPAIESVYARVAEDRARQDKVERRILELENRSYKAGLSAPLTRDHVHQWLESDDDTYESQIQRILDAEVKREEQAQARMRERMDREQREAEAREQAKRERMERADATPGSSKAVNPDQTQWDVKPSTERQKTGTVHVSVMARFDLEVPAHVTDDLLRTELINKMQSAGFRSVPEIVIDRSES